MLLLPQYILLPLLPITAVSITSIINIIFIVAVIAIVTIIYATYLLTGSKGSEMSIDATLFAGTSSGALFAVHVAQVNIESSALTEESAVRFTRLDEFAHSDTVSSKICSFLLLF